MQILTAAEIRALELHRLSNKWSYRQLSEEMDVPETTIQRILTTKAPRLHDTTAYAVREYLRLHVEPEDEPRRKVSA